jgi:peptide/nickel transport system substrate-binding protein
MRFCHAAKLTIAAFALATLAFRADAQTLTIGVRAGPESIDPDYTGVGTHAEAMKHIFDTLVWAGDQLQLEPGLATSWRPIDNTTWEFKLRQNVKFHDGSDFTAEDVKFSIERIPMASGPNSTTVYVKRVKGIKIIDPHTIDIITDGPAPTLPNDFVRLFIVSKAAAAGLTKENHNEAFNSGKAAIGTGPFKFVSWTPKDQLVLERFDQYWRGPSHWKRVIRKEIPNDTARVAQLRTGQVDIIVRAPASDIPTLQRDPKIRVIKNKTIYVFTLSFDFREKTPQVRAKDGSTLAENPLRDPRVREAMDLAIDRSALAQISMEGMGTPASQIITSGIFGYIPNMPIPKPNVKRARELLKEAGYPNGFKVVLNFTNDRLPGDRAVGTSVAQMLAQIGLDVEAKGQPAAVLYPARARGDVSLTMTGWATLTGEANYTYEVLTHTYDAAKGVGSFNWYRYSNPKLDRLIDAAAVQLDQKKRLAILQEAGEMIHKERVVLPLVVISSAWAMQKDKVDLPKPRGDEDTLAYDIVPAKK